MKMTIPPQRHNKRLLVPRKLLEAVPTRVIRVGSGKVSCLYAEARIERVLNVIWYPTFLQRQLAVTYLTCYLNWQAQSVAKEFAFHSHCLPKHSQCTLECMRLTLKIATHEICRKAVLRPAVD